jgi:hypothetical protein
MKKVGNSFKGIIGGIVAIIIGVILLWWNEGNNVKNIKTTNEMSEQVIDVTSDKVDAANEGKLVATHGKLINEETLTDKTFNVSILTPKMTRVVEMYQWVEKSEEDSDGNTTYSYSKEWSSDIVDSSSFHKNGYDNPKTKPYEDTVLYSSNVTVGAFVLSSNQIEMLSTDGVFTDYDNETLNSLGYSKNGNYITNSSNFDNPNIGDVRIVINYNTSSDVSILAVQTGNTFTDFVSSVGKTHNRIMDGVHSGKDIINAIVKENKILKWALRLFGTLLCIIGVATIFKPLSTLANFVPILGGLVDMAVGLVSLISGLALSLVVIAIAWIRFRPLVGIALLLVVGVLVFFLIKKKNEKSNTVNTNEIPSNQ